MGFWFDRSILPRAAARNRKSPVTFSKPIKSPCLSICAVDGRANACVGCGRTLKEIAGWSRMSDEERDAVLRQLPSRIAALGEKASAPQEALAKIREALRD